nr:MAG TPA: hypothetical protein [Caudoviricetes sp.]
MNDDTLRGDLRPLKMLWRGNTQESDFKRK